jgi:hypothetical protein
MSETVYIETSILGYLTAQPSRDLGVAANIEIIREWWNTGRSAFQLYSLNQSVLDLVEQFLERSSLPTKADVDAVHIAAAPVHGMDYLLTWNCKHIANAQIQRDWQKLVLIWGTSYRFFVQNF